MQRLCTSVLALFLALASLPAGLIAADMEISDDALLYGEIPTVVTASKNAEKINDAPGVVTVVTKDEITRFGGTSLKDVLERVPGLIGSSVYMTDRTMIAIRGAQFKENGVHMLLLINGRPVREGQEGGIITETLESFPVTVIERIEVIKGPGSVLYGSGAFAGVINVITEKADKTGAAVTALGGDMGAAVTMGKMAYKGEDVSVVAAGQYRHRADWNIPWQYSTPGGVVQIPAVIPSKGPGSFVDINYKNLRVMSSYNKWENAFFISDYGWTGIAKWEKTFTDAGYRMKVNDMWSSDFNVTYAGSKFLVDNLPSSMRDSYILTADWANFINPSDRLGILIGGTFNYISGQETGQDTPTTIYAKKIQRTYGIYTQLDYWLQQDKMKVIGGVQANKVDELDTDVVPRAGFIFYPIPALSMKINYSQAFRAPSINETDMNFFALQGNPNLKSEKVDTVDFGFMYYKNKLQGGVNFFYSKLTNIIRTDRSGLVPFYNNLGEVEAQGAEIEGKYFATKELFLTASSLYQTSKDKDGTENVNPIANFGAKAGVSYASDKGATVSVFNTYQGPLDSKYDTTTNVSPKAYNLMSLNCRFDMRKLAGLNLGSGVALLVRVDNALDEEIWVPNWGLALGASLPYNQGRTAYLGIEVSL